MDIKDILKRIKASILLVITMMSLSGCSKEDIDSFLSYNYRIVKASELDLDMDHYFYLVKKNNLDLLGDNPYIVIGTFNTLEEAEGYLGSIVFDKKNKLHDEVIANGIVTAIICGALFYFVINSRKKEKVLKK